MNALAQPNTFAIDTPAKSCASRNTEVAQSHRLAHIVAQNDLEGVLHPSTAVADTLFPALATRVIVSKRAEASVS